MALRVQVVHALPREETIALLELPEGATVREALQAAGFPEESPAGMYGERVAPGTRLSDGDRVEVYRPLRMDPKEARRRRAKRKR